MNTTPVQELVDKGIHCYQQKQFKRAQLIFDEVIQQDKSNIDSFFYLANIFHRKGQIGKAIKAFQHVLDLDPNHTDAAISLSVLLNDIGKYEEASKVFEKANQRVKNQEGLQDAHINRKFALKHGEIAELYLSYNRLDEALFEFNKAQRLDPDNLDLRLKIAKVYSRKGYFSKAAEELRKLKSESPSYLPARVALGLLYYGNGNIIEAQTEWQNVLSKEPHHNEAKMYLNLSRNARETNLGLQ